jgi:hypothetical protein
MGMAYLLMLIVYIGVSVGIYKLVTKPTSKRWIKGAVIAFFVLLPTYDIIITKALLFYYCNYTEKEKVYKTVENPESVYFEDKNDFPDGYPEKLQKLDIDNFIKHGNLKSIEFHGGEGEIIQYIKDKKQNIFKKILETDKPNSNFSRIKKRVNGYFVKTITYEFYDLNKKELLGYVKGYYGKVPNMFFLYSSPGADGGSCIESLYKQNNIILKFHNKEK